MAQQQPDNVALDKVMQLAYALAPQERGQLLRHLELRFWDEQWNKVKQELNEKRKSQGLSPATDNDIHAEFESRRNPAKLEAIKRAIKIGIDQVNNGQVHDAFEVLQELKSRAESRIKKSQ